VISALSLAVAAAQLGIKMHETGATQKVAAPTFVCKIEGSKGTRELRIEGAAIPSEAVLRKCLDDTGTPTKIKALPTRKP